LYKGGLKIERHKYNHIKKLKEDFIKAQRMYFLSEKLSSRVLPAMSEFSKKVFNNYVKAAKEIDLKLSMEELYNRVLEE
jgi:hypothetical protein